MVYIYSIIRADLLLLAIASLIGDKIPYNKYTDILNNLYSVYLNINWTELYASMPSLIEFFSPFKPCLHSNIRRAQTLCCKSWWKLWVLMKPFIIFNNNLSTFNPGVIEHFQVQIQYYKTSQQPQNQECKQSAQDQTLQLLSLQIERGWKDESFIVSC